MKANLRPIFRAQDESHVEKGFIEMALPTPDGWFATREEALVAKPARKPGRPPKTSE